jgi:hypothetical protein
MSRYQRHGKRKYPPNPQYGVERWEAAMTMWAIGVAFGVFIMISAMVNP